MTQYNSVNIKLSNSQFGKLKSGIKNGPELTSNLPLNVIDDFNDESNLTLKLLVTDTQVLKLRNTFTNG